jgi:hypothetical protein
MTIGGMKTAAALLLLCTAGCDDGDRLTVGGPKGVTGDSTVATARGGWLLETGEWASSQMAVSIACDRFTNTCTESTARIGKGANGRMLLADGTAWTVTRWDANGIEASMDAACVRWSLLIDFASQQAKKSSTAKSITGICADYATWKPTSFALVDGGPDQGVQSDE